MDQGSPRAHLLRELWAANIDVAARVVSITTTGAIAAAVVAGFVIAKIGPLYGPVGTVAAAVIIVVGVVAFEVWALAWMGETVRTIHSLSTRARDVPPDPHATQGEPAAILRPDDATTVQHLDRILRRAPTDWPAPSPEARRLTRSSAIRVGTLLGLLIGLVIVVQTTDEAAGRASVALLALAAVVPVFFLSQSARDYRLFALVDEARQYIDAQVILDSRALPDDGTSGDVVRTAPDGRRVVTTRSLPRAARPSDRHFAIARGSRRPPSGLLTLTVGISLTAIFAIAAVALDLIT